MNYWVFFLCIGLFLALIPLTQAYEVVSIYTTGNNRPILDLELSPNEGEVIAADGSLYLLNFYEEKVITQGWAATTLDPSDDGNYIVTGSDTNICLFTNGGQREWCDINFPGGAKDIAFSDDNTRIVVGSETHASISLFNLAGKQQWTRFVGTPIYRIALSSAPGYVVIASYRNQFSSYDFNGDLRFNYSDDSEISLPILDVAISDDGMYIVGGLEYANQGKIMQFSSWGDILWEYPLDGLARNVAISTDGSFTAAGTHNLLEKSGSVYYFSFNQSTRKGTVLWNTSLGSSVSYLDMTPDGSYIAVGLQNNHIQLYSRSGEMLVDHIAHDSITTVALSEDGRYIAAGTQTGEIYYLDTGVLFSESIPSNVPVEIETPTSFPITTTISEEPLTPAMESITPIPTTLTIQENVAGTTQLPETDPANQSDIFGGSKLFFSLVPFGLLSGAFFFLIRLQKKER